LSKEEQLSLIHVIETTQRVGGRLKFLAVGTCDKHYVISTEKIGETSLAEAIKLIFNTSDTTLISHDIKQLYTWALSFGLDINCKLFDMIIAEYLIDALASGYSISRLIKKYLGMDMDLPFYNDDKKNKQKETVDEDYNYELLSKALTTFNYIFEKQSKTLSENSQNSLYYDMELPLSLVLGSMEYYGFKVDQQSLEEYGQRLDVRIQSLQQSIWLMAGEEFNINSPKQLGVILFEKLGLRVIKKTKTGYSTSAEVLNDLYHDHEIIPCILEYRQLTKLKSTYVEGLIKVINPQTGRIHSSFNQTVTATGRISSTEPNLQNIPIRTEVGRDIRKAFIPEEGFMFVDADYSQIELRVLAHITGDEMMQKAFTEGIDIHTKTASQVFNVPVDQVTPEMRYNAKAVNFGIVYGISDFSLAKDINVTKKEAAKYINNYLSTFSNVKKYMEDIVDYGKKKGYVETMFHRIRHIPELKSSNFQVRSFGKRIAMNTPIQGSAADIIKIAMVKVWSELKKRKFKSRLILQVHDELLVETAVDELDEVKDIVKRNMEEAAKLSVPLIADISTGKDWFEAK
ncbi:MAG: DNA polymerase I, partial [Clostridiaceae bacterium]|nr:DNA polymerase I [Clostridiaceae bacterium]